MWDVKAGDLVVCIDDFPGRFQPGTTIFGLDGLTANKIYTVRAVGKDPTWGLLVIWTIEIVRKIGISGFEVGFSIDRFRPVSKTRTEEFRALVAPSKLKEVSVA